MAEYNGDKAQEALEKCSKDIVQLFKNCINEFDPLHQGSEYARAAHATGTVFSILKIMLIKDMKDYLLSECPNLHTESVVLTVGAKTLLETGQIYAQLAKTKSIADDLAPKA